MTKQGIFDLIESLKKRQFIDIRISIVSPEVIISVAQAYQLEYFTPEDHPLDFYFLKGYVDANGKISNTKKGAVCTFSLNSERYNSQFGKEVSK
jgi:hypothetical protein